MTGYTHADDPVNLADPTGLRVPGESYCTGSGAVCEGFGNQRNPDPGLAMGGEPSNGGATSCGSGFYCDFTNSLVDVLTAPFALGVDAFHCATGLSCGEAESDFASMINSATPNGQAGSAYSLFYDVVSGHPGTALGTLAGMGLVGFTGDGLLDDPAVGELGPEEGGCSFTATTEVLLPGDKTEPISSLEPGDKVLATSTRTGKTSPEAVAAVEVNHDTDLYNLKVKTAHGVQVIHTTSNHLFWDPYQHQWIESNKLTKGEHLKTPDGSLAVADGGTTPTPTTAGCGTSRSPATTTTTST